MVIQIRTASNACSLISVFHYPNPYLFIHLFIFSKRKNSLAQLTGTPPITSPEEASRPPSKTPSNPTRMQSGVPIYFPVYGLFCLQSVWIRVPAPRYPCHWKEVTGALFIQDWLWRKWSLIPVCTPLFMKRLPVPSSSFTHILNVHNYYHAFSFLCFTIRLMQANVLGSLYINSWGNCVVPCETFHPQLELTHGSVSIQTDWDQSLTFLGLWGMHIHHAIHTPAEPYPAWGVINPSPAWVNFYTATFRKFPNSYDLIFNHHDFDTFRQTKLPSLTGFHSVSGITGRRLDTTILWFRNQHYFYMRRVTTSSLRYKHQKDRCIYKCATRDVRSDSVLTSP